MGLTEITIGIKTFLRDSKLYQALDGIQQTLCDTRIIVADDGEMTAEKQRFYDDLTYSGSHKVINLPFDSGFGAKGNKIVDALETPYILIGSDDFDFKPWGVRKGIEKMLDVLENTDIDIASGRLRGPYEFDLEDLGDTVIEHPHIMGKLEEQSWYVETDLTVNYSLVKARVFDQVRWDDDAKICQGEHGAWFLDAKRAGYKVAWVPNVTISEQGGDDSPRYKQYRTRGGAERSCFVKRGIKRYVLGSGQVDYEKM